MRKALTFPVLVCALLLGAAALLVFAPAAHAQKPQPSRLVMKDGSYQAVVRYEIKGDRVRYLSAERYEWEEVPYSMVDWAATKKWEQERVTTGNPDIRAADAEEQAEKQKEEALSPTVAPGLRLPFNGGVMLMDVYSGRPGLIELQQSGSEINKNTKGNILRAAINPLASARQSIELKGPHAQVQAHVTQPVIYANVGNAEPTDAQSAGGPPARELPVAQKYRIVRLESKKGNRIVGNIKVTLTGKVSQQQALMPTLVEQVSNGPWYKISPASPLAPGEYAIVEMLPDDQINLYVWDFGVNPSAPENPTAWRPAPTTPDQPPPKTGPALEKRPPQ